MDAPELWRWIWLVAAVVFAVGEIFTGGFFLLPFAAGAAVAAGLAFAGVNVGIQWVAGLAVSVAAFAVMRPLARRLDAEQTADGIGSRRLIGEAGTVLEAIAGDDEVGLVRIGREEWRAQSRAGSRIERGARIRVSDVVGTRVVVDHIGAAVAPDADSRD